jgi:hypothetical protein
MAHWYTQSLWDAGNGGRGLNRSHVPFGQRSMHDIPTAPADSAVGLSLRLSLEVTHDSRDDY